MSHEIDFSAGRPAFTFDAQEGEAWHGLGQPIPEEDSKDPRKIAERAGAAYHVSKREVYFRDGTKECSINNRRVLVRDDTGEPLEVLSDNKYKVVQPIEYFESFRDSLAANNLRISSAGVLKGGRIVFVNAKFTDHGTSVLGLDTIERYICLGGGYDGTLASFGYLSDFRTVCWNTLSANIAVRKAENAKGGKGKGFFRIPHSATYDGRALGTALGLAGKELQVRAQVFNTLAGYRITREQVAAYFRDVLELDPVKEVSDKSTATLAKLEAAYLKGPGAQLPTANGTVWGALNAVTHYVDHVAPTRDSYLDGKGAARFASAQFGNGSQTKARALQLAMQAAGIGEELLIAA